MEIGNVLLYHELKRYIVPWLRLRTMEQGSPDATTSKKLVRCMTDTSANTEAVYR